MLTCNTEATWAVGVELPKATFKHYFRNEQGQIIYKDDVIENSKMIDLLTCMIKLKPNNMNQILPFVISLSAKAIAECTAPLEWIKTQEMLTMVKMVKELDEEQIQDTPITSSKLLEKPQDEIKWEEFKHTKDQGKQKSNQLYRDREE